MKIIIMLMMALLISSCASRVKILDASWLSMKNPDGPRKNQAMMKVSAVNEEEYCMKAWSGDFGLIDEVIKQVEKKYEADFIKNASITQTEGSTCVQLSGQAYRLAR